MTTTGAQDVIAGLLAVLDSYKSAHPTLLRQTWNRRPGAFSEFPVAYVGDPDERIIHTAGTRQRTFSPTVVVVDTFGDNGQVGARMDIIHDGLVDAYTAAPFTVSGAICSMTAVANIELREPKSDGGVIIYPAVVFTFAEITLMEGRV